MAEASGSVTGSSHSGEQANAGILPYSDHDIVLELYIPLFKHTDNA
jgi:hypothetical protein